MPSTPEGKHVSTIITNKTLTPRPFPRAAIIEREEEAVCGVRARVALCGDTVTCVRLCGEDTVTCVWLSF